MILLALAAAAAMQTWTGPRTEEYKGPGYFCGGGYAIRLGKGERALILPQGQAPQATRLVLSGGEVNIHTGARPQPGPVVMHYRGGTSVTQQSGDGVAWSPTRLVSPLRSRATPSADSSAMAGFSARRTSPKGRTSMSPACRHTAIEPSVLL